MYCKIKLIHKNIKKKRKKKEINYLNEIKFLVKRMELAESLRLIIKPLTDMIFLGTKLFISALLKKHLFISNI